MTTEIYIEIVTGLLLTIITALIAYMAKSLTDLKAFAFEKIARLEADVKNTNRILSQIIVDLKIVEVHGSAIAVVQSQLSDLRGDVAQIYERVRKLEINKE